MGIAVFSINTDNGRIRMDSNEGEIVITVDGDRLCINQSDSYADYEEVGFALLNEFGPINVKEITIGSLTAIRRMSPKLTELVGDGLTFINGNIVACVGNEDDEQCEYVNFKDNIREAVDRLYYSSLEELMECVGSLVFKACNMANTKLIKSIQIEREDVNFEFSTGMFNRLVEVKEEDFSAEDEDFNVEELMDSLEDIFSNVDCSKKLDQQSDEWYRKVPYRKGLYERFMKSGAAEHADPRVTSFIRKIAEVNNDVPVQSHKEHKGCDGCGKCKTDVTDDDIMAELEALKKWLRQ